MFGLPARFEIEVLSEDNAPDYWERSDRFDLALDLTAGRRGLAALGAVIACWIKHLLDIDVIDRAAKEMRDVALAWYVGLDSDGTRIGDALWNGAEIDEAREQLVGLFRLTFRDPGIAIDGLAGEPVYLILAMTPDNMLRMKPQNLLTGLPIRHLETVHVSHALPLIRIPVGVVIERRKAKSPWVDFVWRPVAVLPGVAGAVPWTVLDGEADRTKFYGGSAEIELYRSDASGYRDNLATGAARLWVALRPTGLDPPLRVRRCHGRAERGRSLHRERDRYCRSVADARAGARGHCRLYCRAPRRASLCQATARPCRSRSDGAAHTVEGSQMSEPENSARISAAMVAAQAGRGDKLDLKRGLHRERTKKPARTSRAAQSEADPPAFDPATLPPIESITATSDIRAFLAPGVPEELTRAALRRVWVTDPMIRDFVGIAENQWDFTKPDSVPGFRIARTHARIAPHCGRFGRRGTRTGHGAASKRRTDGTNCQNTRATATAHDDLGTRGDDSSAERSPARTDFAHDSDNASEVKKGTGSVGENPGSPRRKHGGAVPKLCPVTSGETDI